MEEAYTLMWLINLDAEQSLWETRATFLTLGVRDSAQQRMYCTTDQLVPYLDLKAFKMVTR